MQSLINRTIDTVLTQKITLHKTLSDIVHT